MRNIVHNWWPMRCNFFVYLFVPNQLYMFRTMFSPSSGALDCIYSFWYSPPILLPAGVMDEMERELHLVHDTGQQQRRWTISEAVNTVKCSWWWMKTSPETCRADWVQIHTPKFCILLVIWSGFHFWILSHTLVVIFPCLPPPATYPPPKKKKYSVVPRIKPLCKIGSL
jgi:hypothetical protein